MTTLEQDLLITEQGTISDRGRAELEARLHRMAEVSLERADVEAVLAAYTKRHGLPDLLFDDDATVHLTIADELPLALVHVPPFPGVMVTVRLPDRLAERDDIQRELLRANRSWLATGGGTFAKLPEDGGFLFCRLISLAERDDQAFEREFLAFCEHAVAHARDIELALDLPSGDEEIAGDQEDVEPGGEDIEPDDADEPADEATEHPALAGLALDGAGIETDEADDEDRPDDGRE